MIHAEVGVVQAIRIHETGGPEEMQLEELPTPLPGAGQALVRVEAAGVNFIDIYQRSGAYSIKLPAIMGGEGAGVVEAVGPGVTEVASGDRVGWAMVAGSYATHALVPGERLVHLPEGVDATQGAAAMLQGMTAHYLAFDMVTLEPGDSCLVHAAAGGVGQLLCQMLKMRGVRVIGTTSTEEKARVAREAGADDVILYTEKDFVTETRRLTDGAGVRVVYDSVGRDTFEGSLSVLRPRGSLVLFGQSSGAVPPIDPQILNAKGSLWLTRPTLAHYAITRPELTARASEVLGWIASGKLRLRIDASFPLADAAQAHMALASRRTMGKVLLIP
jgi:NADPH2:quinone reductase